MNDLSLKDNKKGWIPLLFILFIPMSWAVFIVGSVYRNVTLLLAAILLLAINGTMRLTGKNGNTLVVWSVYVLYTFVALVWSTDFSRSFNNCLGMLLVYVIALTFSHAEVNKIAPRYYDVAWILVGVTCVLFFLFGSTETINEYTTRGTLVILGNKTDPNEFSGTFCITASVGAYYAMTGKKWWVRVLNFIAVLFELYVIFAAGSRGALIAAVAAIFVTLFFGIKPTVKHVVSVTLILLVTVVIVVYAVLPLLSEDVMERFTVQAILEDGGRGRSSIWKSGLSTYMSGGPFRLLFGFGYGGVVAEGFYDDTATMHNQFIQILINYGLVGFLLYLVLLARCFFQLVRHNRKYLGGFMGMMALSMTLSLPPTYKPFWVLLVMAFVSELQLQKRGKSVADDPEKVS